MYECGLPTVRGRGCWLDTGSDRPRPDLRPGGWVMYQRILKYLKKKKKKKKKKKGNSDFGRDDGLIEQTITE
ncbi:hypothetical protein KQX54_005402 [Cotesia glomerata]|uniref:Uncharacterized protein n=1 Tax=Cotesia glomerata TaxID=32391 RepID=A0AAV7ILN5_COTGL|nr:hypothetical protein KQX54_005402 [Cotesia glomerata]